MNHFKFRDISASLVKAVFKFERVILIYVWEFLWITNPTYNEIYYLEHKPLKFIFWMPAL